MVTRTILFPSNWNSNKEKSKSNGSKCTTFLGTA